MNSDLQELLRKSAAMQAAVAPMIALNKVFSSPLANLWHRDKYPLASMSSIVSQMFKKPNYFDAAAVIQEHLNTNKARTIYHNSKLWDSIGAISKNQQSIASLFTSNTFLQNSYKNSQFASASFAATINPVLWGYNNKINTLQSALKGISSQIAVKGFTGINTELLNRFTTTTKEAVAITHEITQTEYATTESIAKLETFIGTSLQKFQDDVTEQIKTSSKSSIALVSLWVTILGILITLFSIVQTCQSQNPQLPQAATDQDVQELKKFVGIKFEEALKKSSLEATLHIDCNLRYKPAQSSKGFFRVKAGQTVHIMDTRHKWVRLAVIDPADDLPIMGWVLRKHIIRK